MKKPNLKLTTIVDHRTILKLMLSMAEQEGFSFYQDFGIIFNSKF